MNNIKHLSTELFDTYNISCDDINKQINSVIDGYDISSKICLENYLLSANFNKTLSSSFSQNDYYYDKVNHKFHLNVQGNDLTIYMGDILSGDIIKKVEIVEHDDKKWIRLHFGTETKDFIDIEIQDLVQVYKSGIGINIDDNLCVNIDDTVVQKTYLANQSHDGLMTSSDYVKLSGLSSYTFLSTWALSNDNGTIKIRCGKNLTIDTSNGTLSANEGRIYRNGIGIGLSNDDTFYISASYLTSDALCGISGECISAWTIVSALNGKQIQCDSVALSNESNIKDLIKANSERVWIEDRISGTVPGDYNDLSIIKLPLSDYELSVVGGTIISNTLYIVDSDYVEMYGQQICSLTMGNTEETKYSGIAATDTYVNEKTKNSSNWDSAYSKVESITAFGDLAQTNESEISGHYLPSSDSYLSSGISLSDINGQEITGYVQKNDSEYKNKSTETICSDIGLSDFAYKTQTQGIINSLTTMATSISGVIFDKETDQIEIMDIINALSSLCENLKNIG